MNKSLMEILVDPVSKTPLSLVEREPMDGQVVIEGALRGPEGRAYVITNGIPRFVLTEDQGQKQTEASFGFKWGQRQTYDSPERLGTFRDWLVNRYGFSSVHEMRDFFAGKSRILDAGCGSAFSSALLLDETWRGDWVGVDISSAIDVAQERLKKISNTHFVQGDILQLPFRERSFNVIFSEGVLHHTPSTERALKSLVPLLDTDGEILFYVYRKKGPVREFTDDYVRDLISPLPPEEAWEMLRPLTKLGQALAKLHGEVEVTEDIPYLHVKAGRYDVQRLIYWHFAKLFWNENLSFEENNHVNFDWYHPRYAHRHTEGEIRRWCEESQLKIFHFDEQESGYTVRAAKH